MMDYNYNKDLTDFIDFSSSYYKNIDSKSQFDRSDKEIKLLNEYKNAFEDLMQQIQEDILTLETKKINKYTLQIRLDKLKRLNLSNFNKLFVDFGMYKRFSNEKIINFNLNLCKLYPIQTMGDGNCLCHAVLVYLIGMHDSSHVLRTALNYYLNGTHKDELKKRFLLQRKQADADQSIEVQEDILEKEWSEIQSMSRIEKGTTKEGKVFEREIVIYLGDMHIFALANLLKRTIIIVSKETLKDIQEIHLRGIYLPLLCDPSECIKEPIIIAFHNFHFFPLIYANEMESDRCDDENADYLFETIETTIDSLSKSKKIMKTLTYFPLTYHNDESMKLQFLLEDEEKKALTLLNSYLNITEVPYKRDSGVGADKFEEYPTLCCKLGTKQYKKNGLNMFFDFYNELNLAQMMKRDKCLIATCTLNADEGTKFCVVHSKSKLCETENCMNEALLRGYCADCFTKVKVVDDVKPCRLCRLQTKPLNDGYCDQCYNIVNPTQQTKRTKNYCKSQNCKNEASFAYDGYCHDCYDILKELNKKCKLCNRNAEIECYCRACYNSLSIKRNKQVNCSTKNCNGYVKNANETNGYCDSCATVRKSLSFLNNKCKANDCTLDSAIGYNGFCKSCYDKNITRSFDTFRKGCKSLGCHNEARGESGYCNKCMAEKYGDYCKEYACTSRPVKEGFCKEHQPLPKPKCELCTEELEDKTKKYCIKCIEKHTKRETSTIRQFEIPINIERTPTARTELRSLYSTPQPVTVNYLPTTPRATTTTTTHVPISSYNHYPSSTFRTEFNMPISARSHATNYDAKVCKSCFKPLPRYLGSNEDLCRACMGKYYDRYGVHYTSALSSTPYTIYNHQFH